LGDTDERNRIKDSTADDEELIFDRSGTRIAGTDVT
jgi:hypothetical protein